MTTLLRRFLVLAALMFWQGGFLFYVSVVVPVGQVELGGAGLQAVITRQVTVYLNLAGAVALVPLAWDLAVSRDSSRRRRGWRWFCWATMLGLLMILAWLHPRLGELMDSGQAGSAVFYTSHRWYLWLSTMQWALSVVYAVLTLRAWQIEDRSAVEMC